MKNKSFFIFVMLSVFCFTNLFAQNSSEVKKGKIVITILDVSGSIKKEFPSIVKVLDETVVSKRLSVGDYFVLIPFGDKALPMYSGQLLREEDKGAISNSLKAMKADNNYTDIGSALKTALNYIVDLKGQNFDLYEPLVLFITDGDITTDPKSEFAGLKVDEIFKDSVIGTKPLYDGWYFCGIGKNLHDLPQIARLAGREDYLITIEDLSRLEILLDEWISNIPEPEPLEQGQIGMENFNIYNLEIAKTKFSVNDCTVVDSSYERISFDLVSPFERTPVIMKFVEGDGVFQTDDRKKTVNIKINPEAGNIEMAPGQRKESVAAYLPVESVLGKGILKLHFVTNENGIEKETNLQVQINGKTPRRIFIERISLPVGIVLGIILVIMCIVFCYNRRPRKIRLTLTLKNNGGIIENRKVDCEKKIAVGKSLKIGKYERFDIKFDNNKRNDLIPDSDYAEIKRRGRDSWSLIYINPKTSEKKEKKFKKINNGKTTVPTKDENYFFIFEFDFV